MPGLHLRRATVDDLGALDALMDRAIGQLQTGFLDDTQVAASRTVMGLDRQLVADGCYFVVEEDGRAVGCGGWSFRATRYGGDHSPGRDIRRLDPATEAANVRAMYTDPDHARRGVGRMVLAAAEGAARDAGFSTVQLVATLSGEPLYTACGYAAVERFDDDRAAVPVPLVTMRKAL